MIERSRASNPLFSSFLLITAIAASAVACGGDGGRGTGSGGGGGGGTGGSTSASTGANTTTSGGGQVILSCGQNLAYVASCRLDASTYSACSDFFGNHMPKALENQCIAGNGTFSTTPCDLDDRAGACVFYNDALPDRCYVEHIAPPSAADFWAMTCPQAGGVWTPAE
jgi:hypothetical protein